MGKKPAATSSLLDQILEELYTDGPKGHILEADECTAITYRQRYPDMSESAARESLERAVKQGIMTSFLGVINRKRTRIYKLTKKAKHGRCTHS